MAMAPVPHYSLYFIISDGTIYTYLFYFWQDQPDIRKVIAVPYIRGNPYHILSQQDIRGNIKNKDSFDISEIIR